ncbi:MAG: hypothetical protein JO362_10595 [Streptomycetaceae bacterium]|nr:hypothetical protein [Streptomycetaceae bacterium]
MGAQRPDNVLEREQHRVHRTVTRAAEEAEEEEEGVRLPRRHAFAVDGKCLRGAVPAEGGRMFVLTAVCHDDAMTAALRKISASPGQIHGQTGQS